MSSSPPSTKPLFTKALAFVLLAFWIAPLYVGPDGRAAPSLRLAREQPLLCIGLAILAAFAWASWTGRYGARLVTILAFTVFVDAVATLVDGERFMYQPATWLFLIALVFALAMSLDEGLRALARREPRDEVSLAAIVLALLALAPVYKSFQAQKRERNPIYAALTGRTEQPVSPELPPAESPPAEPAVAAAPFPAPAPPETQSSAETSATDRAETASARPVPLTDVEPCGRSASSSEATWRRSVASGVIADFDRLERGGRVSATTLDGAFYTSADRRLSWTMLNCGALYHFRAVSFVTRERGWSVGSVGPTLNGQSAFAHTVDGGATWSVRALGTALRRTPGALRDIRFRDDGHGTAIATHDVFVTDDGGMTWRAASVGVSGAIAAVEMDAGGSVWIYENAGRGHIVHRSYDGGESWQVVDAAQAPPFPDTAARTDRCPNPAGGDDAWRIACGGALERTDDGGATWTAAGPFNMPALAAVNFANSAAGWVLGGSGVVLRTTDSGATWIRLQAPTDEDFVAGSWNDARTGWALTQRGTVLRFDEGGTPWTVQRTGGAEELWHDLYMLDSQYGWAVGARKGEILLTRDGGAEWQSRSTLYDETLRAVRFVDRDYGWAVGERGIVLHSRDGGLSWVDQPLPTGMTFSTLHFRDRTHGWIAGDDELLFRTDDGGSTWVRVAAPAAPPFFAIRFDDERRGRLVANDGWYVTDDGGANWTAVAMPQEPYGSVVPARAWLAADGTAWAIASRNSVWRHDPSAEPAR